MGCKSKVMYDAGQSLTIHLVGKRKRRGGKVARTLTSYVPHSKKLCMVGELGKGTGTHSGQCWQLRTLFAEHVSRSPCSGNTSSGASVNKKGHQFVMEALRCKGCRPKYTKWE